MTGARHFPAGFFNYVVVTHPHSDHIGGMAEVLDAVDVGAIYMPRIETTTQTFENLLDKIDAKSLKITPARAGGLCLG
jgi:beta-lactamase superfamily II metal-dependent hydrolase